MEQLQPSTISAADGAELARQLHAQINREIKTQEESGCRIRADVARRFSTPRGNEYFSTHSSVDFPEDVENAGFDAMVQYALQLRNQETREQVAQACDVQSDMVLA